MRVSRDDDAALVSAVRGGDTEAFSALFRRWSDPCFDVARRILHDDGLAAEVAQETFLVAWRQLDSLQDPAAFGGWVLRTARNKALNRLERDGRSRPTSDDDPVLATRVAPDDPHAAVSANEQQELVWAAAAALGERDASVLSLHLRLGLGAPEIAAELGVTPNNAHQLLFRMKQRLAGSIRAWVLYRGGDPRCGALAAALAERGVVAFGPEAVQVVGAHVPTCVECERRQTAVLAPEAMFAAVPVLVMAPTLRTGVVEALRAAGVPLGSTAAVPPDPGTSGGPPTGVDEKPGGQSNTGPAAGRAAVAPEPDRRRRTVAAALLALLVLLGMLGAALLAGDDAEPVVAVQATTTDSTTAPSTTAVTGATTGGASSTTTTPSTTTTTLLAAPPPSTGGSIAGPGPGGTQPRSGPGATGTAPEPGSATSPRATTTTTRPPATTTTAAPKPRVDSFTATPSINPGGACPAGRWATKLVWSTTNASTVTIAATTVSTLTGLAPDGNRVVCRLTVGAPPGGWKLTASGPGGTASAIA